MCTRACTSLRLSPLASKRQRVSSSWMWAGFSVFSGGAVFSAFLSARFSTGFLAGSLAGGTQTTSARSSNSEDIRKQRNCPEKLGVFTKGSVGCRPGRVKVKGNESCAVVTGVQPSAGLPAQLRQQAAAVERNRSSAGASVERDRVCVPGRRKEKADATYLGQRGGGGAEGLFWGGGGRGGVGG